MTYERSSGAGARSTLLAGGILVVAFCATQCGGSGDSSSSDGDGSGGDAGGGAMFGFGGNLSSGGTDGSASGGTGAFEECQGESVGVEGIELDMYIVLDKSGSMNEPGFQSMSGMGDCDIGQMRDSKWCFTINAIQGFFNAPASRNMRAALSFFSGEGAQCNGASLANADVPLESLGVAAHRNALRDAMNAEVPEGFTPTEEAIRGINRFTRMNEAPPRTMIGILITDGEPTRCNEGTNALANLVSGHLNNTGIRTFVIGMNGANFDALEAWAIAGGGEPHDNFCNGPPPCHHYDVEDGNSQALIGALRAIQEASVIPCEYTIPDPPPGKVFDPRLVNIELSQMSGDTSFPAVSTEDDCDPQNGGWYYDDPAAPTRIRLCSASCDAVTGVGSGATLHVSYGCENELEPPQ